MSAGPARWARLERLYEDASALAVADRPAFLAAECEGDDALRDEVLAMLRMDAEHALSIERLVNDTDVASLDDPLIGAVLGSWRIVSPLGRGGAGVVYRAERADGQYQQTVALKLVGPGLRTPDVIQRFVAERATLARLSHPNIARLIDGGFTPEGTPFLVMEFVDGQPLTEYCDARGLTTDERLRLFRVACAAVQHAHNALVVHRDLKPSNIFVSSTGDVKLLDFGIAKLLEADAGAAQSLTLTEHRMLTPGYAAPEYLRGEPVTTAADVYSLGVVLYEVLTGQRPFASDKSSSREFTDTVSTVDPVPPSAIASRRATRRLRGDLDHICLMALRKEPSRRYSSAGQLADEITRFLEGSPVLAQAPTVRYLTARFIARHRLGVAAAAVLVAVVLAFGLVATWQARTVALERDSARIERDKAAEVVQVLVDLFQTSNPRVVPGGDRLTTGEFLSRAEGRMLASLGERPEIKSTMKHVLGQVHAARSDYPRARALLEEAVADARVVYGDDGATTLRMQVDLGALLLQLGDRSAAHALLQETLARLQRTVGERDLLTARCLIALGKASGGDPRVTRPFFERALATRRSLLAPTDLEIAEALNAVAVADLSAERLADAQRLLEEAVRIVESHNDGRNVRAISVISDLATVHNRRGELTVAEGLYRRSAALASDLIGPESFEAMTALNNLGTILASQGKLEEAAALFQASHERHVKLLGQQHARTANAARNVAMSLLFLERADEAAPWMEQATRAIVAAEGDEAINSWYFRAQQARVTEALGRRADAIETWTTALARMEALAPREGVYPLADTHLWLGRARLAAGQAAAAEPHLRYAVEYRRRSQPAEHPQRAVAECDLARAYAALGRNDDARGLLATCVPRIRGYALLEPALRAAAMDLNDRLR